MRNVTGKISYEGEWHEYFAQKIRDQRVFSLSGLLQIFTEYFGGISFSCKQDVGRDSRQNRNR